MRPGTADILIGGADGDEGKAKGTDTFNRNGLQMRGVVIRGVRRDIDKVYKMGVRGNGGGNAGHTLKIRGVEYKLHAIPSAAAVPGMQLYIGSGCVVNPIQLLQECIDLERQGLSDIMPRLKISIAATTITPIDILFDIMNGKKIGTTGNGIGQAYAAQAIRADEFGITNIRFAEAIDIPAQELKNMLRRRWDALRQSIQVGAVGQEEQLRLCAKLFKNEQIKDTATLLTRLDTYVQKQIDSYLDAISTIARRGVIEADLGWINKQISKGHNVLVEGAQAIGLGKRHGPVPYVTSSDTTPGAILEGADIDPRFSDIVIGTFKSIGSRVGNGPFPEEFGGSASEKYCADTTINRAGETERCSREDLLRSRDPLEFSIGLRNALDEYGATTGRPRRVGMPNAERAKDSCARGGIDIVFLTKVDSLALFARTPVTNCQIPLVTGLQRDGEQVHIRPLTDIGMRQLTPIITHLPAFAQDIRHVRDARDLPAEARTFIGTYSEIAGTPVAFIGVGPDREALIQVYK